jgi:hypothetical protein
MNEGFWVMNASSKPTPFSLASGSAPESLLTLPGQALQEGDERTVFRASFDTPSLKPDHEFSLAGRFCFERKFKAVAEEYFFYDGEADALPVFFGTEKRSE